MRNLRLLGCIALVAFGLSACEPMDRSDEPMDESERSDEPTVLPSGEAAAAAARNRPVAGSVTQGSRAIGGVTADRVRWQDAGGVSIDNLVLSARVEVPAQGGLTFYTNSNESALAAVVSRITGHPETAQASLDTNDPVAFGFWMYRTGGDNFVWGAFADGLAEDQTATASIPSEAGYQGETVGVYTDALGEVEFFTATITLGLDGGTLTGGGVTEVTDPEGEPVILEGGISPQVLFVGDATSSTDGLLEGTATLNVPGNVSGRWGVQIYGEDGDYVGGTWGVTDGSNFSVVGSFRADRIVAP